jgi:hypothetical protein
MGLLAAFITILGFASTVLGVLSIVQVPAEPIFSAKLTWSFWMELAAILFLLAIIFLLARKPKSD